MLPLSYYYKFDVGDVSNNYLLNYATNIYDGSMSLAVSINSITKKKGTGSGSFIYSSPNYPIVTLPTFNTQDYTNGISISFWIYPIVLSNYLAFINILPPTSQFALGYYSNAIWCNMYGTDIYTAVSVPLNVWTNIVWCIGPSTNKLNYMYVNNTKTILSTIHSIPITNTVCKPTIGTNAGVVNYNGYIDDVRIYKTILSATEINNIYTT
jgi:hypothetical protein